MLIVSLTGGIATGKSVVAQVLKDLGCYIYEADLVAHRLMEPKEPAWEKIIDSFGRSILNADKTINRAKLGAIVFSNKKNRHHINLILHPLILKHREEEVKKVNAVGHFNIFVSEAALTVEAGYDQLFDKIVVTHCQNKIQMARLMERDQIDRKDAQKRIESQMPSEQKLEYADYSIDTSGTIPETIEQSEQVFRFLMSDYEISSGKKQQIKLV